MKKGVLMTMIIKKIALTLLCILSIIFTSASYVNAFSVDVMTGYGIHSGGGMSAEFYASQDNILISMWGDYFTKPSPDPAISVTDIDISQVCFGIAYRHNFQSSFFETGLRIKYHEQAGKIITGVDLLGKPVMSAKTLIKEEKWCPYIAVGGIKQIGKIGLSAYGAIDVVGYDIRAFVFYNIQEKLGIIAGYRYWSMDEWYKGFFIGLNSIK